MLQVVGRDTEHIGRIGCVQTTIEQLSGEEHVVNLANTCQIPFGPRERLRTKEGLRTIGDRAMRRTPEYSPRVDHCTHTCDNTYQHHEHSFVSIHHTSKPHTLHKQQRTLLDSIQYACSK